MDDQERGGEDRSAQVRGALLKALAGVVVIGVVIAVGTTIVVRALGLNESDSPGPVGSAPSVTAEPLPTTALPVPGQDETETPDPTEEPDSAETDAVRLQISPATARPMERVNLTGTYRGADDVGLQVQRFEAGNWRDFGVTATVRAGIFETYIMTGRPGEQRLRMYDTEGKQGSNVVLLTIE